MLIKNMEYLSQRLRCTDEEKDACLETVTAILHFWTDTRKNGLLAIGGDRAEQASIYCSSREFSNCGVSVMRISCSRKAL